MLQKKILALILTLFAFNNGADAQTTTVNNTEVELSRFEKIYNILPENNDEIQRLNNLEMKAIGLTNKGSVEQRLDLLEKSYINQLDQCPPQIMKPVYSPIIEKPDKNISNPLNYDYQPEYGNYFDVIKTAILKQGNRLSDYHFKKFPITFYIEPSNPGFDNIIRLSLNEYKKIIPIEETNSAYNHDIKITVINKDTMASITGDPEKLGINKTAIKTENDRVVEFKSEMYLNNKIFNYPMSVYASETINHEFLHSLGLNGHSSSVYDILYPRLDINILYGAQVGLIKNTCQFKDFKQFSELSPVDLNTLWLLYNEW